jgi:GDP-4-dehydro-6-deoxy-D-mannose reductase
VTEPKRILVTGADGFVGRHLLPALHRAIPSAILIAANRTARHETGVSANLTVHLDLFDLDSVDQAIRTVQPDGLVHLAAQAEVPASFANPGMTWRTNLSGTLSLAEAVMRHAPACRFVLASTAEVYGLSFRASDPLDESAAMAPANPYAASKAAADLAIGEMALRGLDAVRLRAFNHTGPGQSANFVIPTFARQVARIKLGLQEPVLRVGNLDRWRDFLDVRDICQGYVAALRIPSAPGAIFNLASGTPRRIGDILEALIARAGISPRTETEVARLRPTDVARVVGNSLAARVSLGWAPTIPWMQTLDDVLADWRGREPASTGIEKALSELEANLLCRETRGSTL